MHPTAFKEYWGLTNAELASLTGYSLDGVQNWQRKTSPGKIPESVFALLDQLHLTFSRWETEEDILPTQHREIFLMAYNRRQEQREEQKTKK